MKAVRKNALKFFIFTLVSALAAASPLFAQQSAPPQCLTEQEAKNAISLLNNPLPKNTAENKILRRELLNMQEEYQKLEEKISGNWQENQKLIPILNQTSERNFLRLCEIVKQYGWVREELASEEGAAAALFIIRGNNLSRLRREIFPVVVAASDKGYAGKSLVAWMIDDIRVSAGAAQIFGTQTRIRDEVFYLYPLQNEERVDEWRKMYNLPPLDSYIRFLQTQFQTVVIKSPRAAPKPKDNKQISTGGEKTGSADNAESAAATAGDLLEFEKDEPIKIESNLVNLNVRVSIAVGGNSATASTTAATGQSFDFNLQKEDFVILENGKPQQIEFFSAADAPFDLVLLLDLSGSTADKQDLIRKSTQRFVEAARPADRIAIVTFTNDAKIISDLTGDRQQLLESLKNIRDYGGSGVWSAIDFAYEKIIKPQSQQRRRSAIVIMTDGVDSSLLPGALVSASPTFTDLLETVRRGETTLVPIYLDTEKDSDWVEKKAFRTARRTLSMLAEESGGQMYYARKVEDLNGVYEKVINDLGRVYSLGYQSSDENRDGAWRTLNIQIPNHPNLSARAKPGYYAN